MTRISFAMAFAIAGIGFAPMAPAADLQVKAPLARPAPPDSPLNWNGIYIGANAGGAFTEWKRNGFFEGNHVGDTFNNASATFGVTVGYNWQMGSNWLIGFEGDWNRINSRVTRTVDAGIDSVVGGLFDPTSAGDLRSTWFATYRARLGYIVDPRLLLFVTAGGAAGDTKLAVSSIVDEMGGVGSQTKTHMGWTAGTGFEYALAPRWTVKAEYLHVDLGNPGFMPVTGANAPLFATNVRTSHDVVRFGTNYRFGAP
jgi:outer membrane immunogenic protein